ncbi:MAG: hypothetical protein U9Q95_01225 [Candidatus Eisenbacteria bacterium]|nr:hypothetical protein [Candidatus Eisenbacteria bacterium]
MRLWPAILHGFALAVITIVAVAVGFAVYNLVGLRDQIAVQVLTAGIVCVVTFAVWGFAVHRLSHGRLSLVNLKELGVAYAAALLWTPVLFVPVHYVTQGYLTSFGNILATWLFQVPFNLLALMVANGRLMVAASGGD